MLESIFSKVASRKETPTQVLSYPYCKFFNNIYFQKRLETTASDASFTIDGLHLFWFRKLARMRVNLAGKKQGEHNSYQTKPSFSDDQSFGDSQNII